VGSQQPQAIAISEENLSHFAEMEEYVLTVGDKPGGENDAGQIQTDLRGLFEHTPARLRTYRSHYYHRRVFSP
jgi:hypothetical protein